MRDTYAIYRAIQRQERDENARCAVTQFQQQQARKRATERTRVAAALIIGAAILASAAFGG